MNLAPIVLFVYNRPWHTQQTVEALQKNELAKDSELFIYSDEAKNENARENVDKVRKYIDKIEGFKKVTIIKREKNWGLADSIIDGVTKIINKYGKVIVLEDDLVTSPYFLKFMNEGLEVFQKREDIFSITGFSFSSSFMKFPKGYEEDIYLNIRPMSWSWGTWKDRWQDIDWEIKGFNDFANNKNAINEFNKGGTDLFGMLKLQMENKLDSWYIRWTYNAYLKKQYTVYPKISFVNNVGHDNSGVHCSVDTKNIYSHTELNNNSNFVLNNDITLNKKIIDSFNKGFNVKFKSKIKKYIKRLFKI
ncbi:glycosyltransferase [Sulfurovum sp. zt1-1]|uniref:Glycosyltransferase n=1 Tax=Sulfurovum zhangzhouensis TaxID=3019067 RepID=A0ABT7QZX9_9BACT|nr:glycosyltransferase [Sulfurovum zhangzhouensis]MDM5272403.1 glycosyltransferase [Sulfurovum zhangzhouensis]